MTLVVTINGPETIWLLADRRLSVRGRPVKDDARKFMFLETTDGVAILGYAGLGATALGTEPADWMSAVLRGRKLPLEQSLGVVAEAMKKQLPKHLRRIPGPGGPVHNVIVPAFIGDEARVYSIDIVFAPDRRRYWFRYTRYVVNNEPGVRMRTPRVGLGGSGSLHLLQDKRWMRGLLRLVRASDRLKVPPQAVADRLARINDEVHAKDETVGPRCIVAWRHRKGGVHNGGGGHQFYTGASRDRDSASIPTIANGMDVNAIVGVMLPHTTKMFEAMRAGRPAQELDKDAINAELALLPDKPDEKLR